LLQTRRHGLDLNPAFLSFILDLLAK